MSTVRKAVAGGITGAVAAAGTFVIAGDGDPVQEVGRLALTLLGGFVLGFVGVYVAPANEIPAVRR